MRVLLLSKACIVGQYQSKLSALGRQPGIELTVVVPPSWKDERGTVELERSFTDGYQLIVTPLRLNSHYHLHYYPQFKQIVQRLRPELVHLDEEPYNLATFQALRHIRSIVRDAKVLFFTWQNILRNYPPPFSWMERYVHRYSDAAIAGTTEAEQVLRAKGFAKPIQVIPQFGVPPTFSPARRTRQSSSFVIGYAGRLVPEKGVSLLLDAVRAVSGDWELCILGSGPLLPSLERTVQAHSLSARTRFIPWAASAQMPQFYNDLDVLVVPSLTMPNWKEQFGRVIMEAMACGVPVIGSDSGEIPRMIGDAGVVFPEGNTAALAQAIQSLIDNPAERARLAALSRARAVERFSEARIVADTYALYNELIKKSTTSF